MFFLLLWLLFKTVISLVDIISSYSFGKEYEGRTKNKELEQMIKKRIAEFEKENGKIEL